MPRYRVSAVMYRDRKMGWLVGDLHGDFTTIAGARKAIAKHSGAEIMHPAQRYKIPYIREGWVIGLTDYQIEVV